MFEDDGPVHWGIWIRGAGPLDPPGALGPADDTDGILEGGILRVPPGWVVSSVIVWTFPMGKNTIWGIHREDVLFWEGHGQIQVAGDNTIPSSRDRKWKTVLSAKSK